jgi:hypothetical protein
LFNVDLRKTPFLRNLNPISEEGFLEYPTATYRVFQVGRDGARTAEYGVVVQSGRGLAEALQKLLQQESEW